MNTRVTIVALFVLFASLLSACDWAMGGFNASRSGFNPENVLTPANVGGVTEQWNANLPLSDPGQSGPSGMMPAVSNGVVYVTHNLITSNNNAGRLYAFDAAGQTNCTAATPRSCDPLWSAVTQTNNRSDPAVGRDTVFVTAPDFAGGTNPESLGALYAFDKTGTTNCAGTPTVCTPKWTARVAGPSGFTATSPVLSGGRVYVWMSGQIQVFDEFGQQNCSGAPKVCAPLFTINQDSDGFAVANGKLYAGGGSNNPSWVAYDATGQQNCSGIPRTCEPLFGGADLSACEGSEVITCDGTRPVVANGKVFMGVAAADAFSSYGSFSAFDAAGGQNCHSPGEFFDVECDPVWTTGVRLATYTTVSASNSTVYVNVGVRGSFPSPGTTSIAGFDVNGVNGCSTTAGVTTCEPVQTFDTSGRAAITPGLLFVDRSSSIAVFPTDGGSQITSIPVADPVGHAWHVPVQNGRIYVPGRNILRVYGLS